MGFFKRRDVSSMGEKKKDMPEGLWTKCPKCSEILYVEALNRNLRICPKCNHHFSMSARERVKVTVDENSFEELDTQIQSVDALGFKGYLGKVHSYQEKTGLNEAVLTGRATIHGHPVMIAVMDFSFLGASMGSVVGEKITRAIELATKESRGVVIFSASGGARMHEGILSLMQMAKTCGALARHSEAGLPYVSVLCHPTTGGVTASFATIGDINLAEPGAMIGFAGPRVVKETTHSDLPPGFQTSEFMKDHGLVDRIVSRNEMRDLLGSLFSYLLTSAR